MIATLMDTEDPPRSNLYRDRPGRMFFTMGPWSLLVRSWRPPQRADKRSFVEKMTREFLELDHTLGADVAERAVMPPWNPHRGIFGRPPFHRSEPLGIGTPR